MLPMPMALATKPQVLLTPKQEGSSPASVNYQDPYLTSTVRTKALTSLMPHLPKYGDIPNQDHRSPSVFLPSEEEVNFFLPLSSSRDGNARVLQISLPPSILLPEFGPQNHKTLRLGLNLGSL